MNMQEPLKQKIFETTFSQSPECSLSKSNDYHQMRQWQREAFEKLKDARFMIMNAPMGSGKSWMMCLLASYKMKCDKTLRCIISVPQEIIGPGFCQAKLTLPDGDQIDWHPTHYLCERKPGQSTTNYIIDWLQHEYDSLSERTLICTHRALVLAHKKLKILGKEHLLQNLLLWVDEAHHIKNSETDGMEDYLVSNSLGQLVADLLDQKIKNVQTGLTTASFFRGDRCSLLTNKMEQKFVRFDLPYDKYLGTMKHLKTFNFDFLLCGHDYTKGIGSLLKHRRGKDIIYIPHPRSKSSLGNKVEEVQSILNEYSQLYGEAISNPSSIFIELQSSGQTFKILDLVDIDQRNEKKKLFKSGKLKNDSAALDSIIALGMFKEGADWIWADRSIIVGPRASFVDVIQMIGRLFRDAETKTHVEVIQILPFVIDQKDTERQEKLNNYFKAIGAALLLEDILKPVLPTPKAESTEKEPGHNKRPSSRLVDLISNESEASFLIEEAYKLATRISETAKKENKDTSYIYETFRREFIPIIETIQSTNRAEDIANKLYLMMIRQTLHTQGMAVESIDINLIKSTHPLDGLLRYTSEAFGINNFEMLKEAIRCAYPNLTKEIIINWVRSYIDKHKRKPYKSDGIVEFAEGEFKGIIWNSINSALNRGNRGLPGNSSLSDLIEENFDIKNPKNAPQLSENSICDLIQTFIDLYERKPQSTDENVPGIEGLSWANIDRRLREGSYGLPGGSSLAQLIRERFSIRDQVIVPTIPLEMIHSWVESYLAEYREKPTAKSGKIKYASGEFQGLSWHSVNQAIKTGKTSLPKGSTLADYIAATFGIKNPKKAVAITKSLVLKWVDQFMQKHERKPTVNDGIIEFAGADFPGLTWRLLNNYLSKGGRSLQGGSSLSKLIKEKF
jgi:hypothetical protein